MHPTSGAEAHKCGYSLVTSQVKPSHLVRFTVNDCDAPNNQRRASNTNILEGEGHETRRSEDTNSGKIRVRDLPGDTNSGRIRAPDFTGLGAPSGHHTISTGVPQNNDLYGLNCVTWWPRIKVTARLRDSQ